MTFQAPLARHSIILRVPTAEATTQVVCRPPSGCRGIDVVRNKIKMFAQQKVTLPPGRHKIIILDEADRCGLRLAGRQGRYMGLSFRCAELHAPPWAWRAWQLGFEAESAYPHLCLLDCTEYSMVVYVQRVSPVSSGMLPERPAAPATGLRSTRVGGWERQRAGCLEARGVSTSGCPLPFTPL
jgi:hypothetical protein